MTSFTRTEIARMPGGIRDCIPEPAFSPASLLGGKNSARRAMGNAPRPTTEDFQVEALAGSQLRYSVPPSRRPLHLGTYGNAVGGDLDVDAWGASPPGTRLQSAINRIARSCAEARATKPISQKPSAILSYSSKSNWRRHSETFHQCCGASQICRASILRLVPKTSQPTSTARCQASGP